MTEILWIATVWLGLAVFSTILANHLACRWRLWRSAWGSPRGRSLP